MRALCLLVLLGCTSTRQLASPADPHLRAPIRGDGIVVPTQTRWKERIDPNTRLWLRNTDGTWSDRLEARDLHVDQRGLWVDRGVLRIANYADEVELVGVTPELLAVIEEARPAAGELIQDGEAWRMRGSVDSLRRWLEALEAELTPTGNARRVVAMCVDQVACGSLSDADARARARYAAFDVRLAQIRIHTPQQGWRQPLYRSRLIDALRIGVTSKVGWPWERVAAIQVENLSGGKSLAAIVGTMAVAVVVLPIAMVADSMPGQGFRPNSSGGSGGSGGSGVRLAGGVVDVLERADTASSHGAPMRGAWQPELASTESVRAKPMFSTRAQVHAIIRPTLALDTSVAKTGDLVGTGLIAKLRLMDVFEIGGGVRLVGTRDDRGWHTSTTHVFAMGTHLPLDAAHRFALPIGFEASGGGNIAHDVRIPWGFRVTQRSGRWFGTVMPATPAWMRTTSEKTGRWTLNGSVEVGVTF